MMEIPADYTDAARFLAKLDPEAEFFTFQTFDDTKAKRRDLARVVHGSFDRIIKGLIGYQIQKAGVFVTVNATDGKGRQSHNVERVRAVFVDLDGSPLKPVLECGLQPHIVCESSGGKWHCYWLTADCPLEQFERVQRALAAKFAGDTSVHDLSRVMRLPGFQHFKGEPFKSRLHDELGCDVAPYPLVDICSALALDLNPPKAAPQPRQDGQGATIEPGDRHAHLFSFGRAMASRGVATAAVHAALSAENLARCNPPVSSEDIDYLTDRAFTAKPAQGWQETPKQAKPAEEPEERAPDVKSALDYRERVADLWRRGLPPGDKTGWPSVDRHYTVCPGQLSIVTGWPGAGKSEWLDALMVNLSRQSWKFAICSFENQPVEIHIAKLMEKLSGRPFGTGVNQRIPEEALPEYCDELDRAYRFITPKEGGISLRRVVDAATPFLFTDDGMKRGLVVDPYNELEHWRPSGMSETEYVSEQLSFIRGWARRNEVHVWIVAHPQKVPREGGKLPTPRPDMISGSQHWWNKADCAITVWRNPETPDAKTVDIIVQKIRFKHIGKPGVVTLNYNKINGRYAEQSASQLYAVARDGE